MFPEKKEKTQLQPLTFKDPKHPVPPFEVRYDWSPQNIPIKHFRRRYLDV